MVKVIIYDSFFNQIEDILENKIQKGCYKKFIGVLKDQLTDLSLNKCILSGFISLAGLPSLSIFVGPSGGPIPIVGKSFKLEKIKRKTGTLLQG